MMVRAASDRYGRLCGSTPAMRRLFDQLDFVVATDCGLLIEGESGTGRSLVAEELHRMGPRASGPFVALDCAALPQALAGDALRDALARAATGTLFLDEIAELSPALQHEASVIGDGGRGARLVASTHRDLATLVREGLFREELYRSFVLSVRLPPLRDRLVDLPALARAIAQVELSDGELAGLRARDWPGNLRQLAEELHGGRSDDARSFKRARAQAVRRFEALYTRSLMRVARGDVVAAARAAAVSPAFLISLLDE
jgi:DNA-binding NtrC family response regulator